MGTTLPDIRAGIWTAREGIEQSVGLANKIVDLRPVLKNHLPDHAHWKEKDDPPFDTGRDFYHWAMTWGVLPFLWHKYITARRQPLPEASRRLFTTYFRNHGIYGEVVVSGAGLYDYHTGVRINVSDPYSWLWSPKHATRLLPEIDFKVGFQLLGDISNHRQMMAIERDSWLFVNGTRTPEGLYKMEVYGHLRKDERGKRIRDWPSYVGQYYDWLEEVGLGNRKRDVTTSRVSQDLITDLLAAQVK